MKFKDNIHIENDINETPFKIKNPVFCENLNSEFLNGNRSSDFFAKKIFKFGDGSSTEFLILHEMRYEEVIILIYNNTTSSIATSGYIVSEKTENSFKITFQEKTPEYLEYSCIIIK